MGETIIGRKEFSFKRIKGALLWGGFSFQLMRLYGLSKMDENGSERAEYLAENYGFL